MSELLCNVYLEAFMGVFISLLRAIVNGKIDSALVKLEFGSKKTIFPEVFRWKMVPWLVDNL